MRGRAPAPRFSRAKAPLCRLVDPRLPKTDDAQRGANHTTQGHQPDSEGLYGRAGLKTSGRKRSAGHMPPEESAVTSGVAEGKASGSRNRSTKARIFRLEVTVMAEEWRTWWFSITPLFLLKSASFFEVALTST